MNAKTYQNAAGIAKTGQSLREFGERQNALNAGVQEELTYLRKQNQALSGQLSAALERIAALEKALERVTALEQEQVMNIRRFGRCAADLDVVEKEIDRLKLTSKLNSNAIDRLTKKNS